MEHVEYFLYFTEGPINVSVNFGKDRSCISDGSTTPGQIGEFIEWLQEHPGAPVFFDDHPCNVSRVEYVAGRNALVLHAERQR